MKIRLNLATKPLENQRRFVVTYGVAGVAALVTLILLSVHVVHVRRADSLVRSQISQTEDDIQSLRQQQESLRTFFSQPAQREKIERAAFLNSLIQQRSFPWTEIFQDLETTLPTGVRLVSIAPQLQKGHLTVKLVIGAQGDDGKLQFLKALEKSKSFSQVEVRQETHPKESQGGFNDRVLMELEAMYSTT
jgi:Tfp pilus assembly protein PilN